jgi:antibiotic biosynthesis monooxygenase (ABM) superfamily enzyme
MDTDIKDRDRIVMDGKDGKGVTVVVSRNVFPGHEREYDEWVRKLLAAAKQSPGNKGVTMLIPQPGKSGLYHVVMRFADEKSVHQWETSYIRQKLSHEADEFSRRVRQEASGLETWFSIPECPELETPPRWKMAIVTFIAVYVLASIIIPVLDIFLKEVNFYLTNILVSVLLVGILTWVVMPWFSRYVFRKWLYK